MPPKMVALIKEPIVTMITKNHLEERLLDKAQAWASYTPLFWGSFA